MSNHITCILRNTYEFYVLNITDFNFFYLDFMENFNLDLESHYVSIFVITDVPIYMKYIGTFLTRIHYHKAANIALKLQTKSEVLHTERKTMAL